MVYCLVRRHVYSNSTTCGVLFSEETGIQSTTCGVLFSGETEVYSNSLQHVMYYLVRRQVYSL